MHFFFHCNYVLRRSSLITRSIYVKSRVWNWTHNAGKWTKAGPVKLISVCHRHLISTSYVPFQGKLHYIIDSGIHGTFNLGVPGKEHYTEMNISLHNVGKVMKSVPIFSPITERHQRNDQNFTLRDIKKGEEILCNYLEY